MPEADRNEILDVAMGDDGKALKEGPAVNRTNKATTGWEILRQHVEVGVPLTVLAWCQRKF
ncbi:hypothetical protein DQ353_20930 [Arthrobacter sp. AQ5-05]|nr:hypothetical protein DQ353_20930 [Arthrobacter sp. AQ5-05]